MKNSDATIHSVADTALWVAVYRAQETERPDALFQDPFARRLAGERGFAIARKMSGTQYTAWSLVIRTVIIDNYINDAVAEGVDTIVNLGAGLDTRPYRLKLPKNLNWIEVDFPHMIDFKNSSLANEKPFCQLERISVDLTQKDARQDLFANIASKTKKALILTEGVTPYLTNADVAALADELHSYKQFAFWVVDYFSPEVLKYMGRRRRKIQMRNAPLQFAPGDWFEFFKAHRWIPKETRFIANESERLGRPIPIPWWAKILRFFFGQKLTENHRKFVAYVLLAQE